MSILEWLGFSSRQPEADDDAIRRIARELDALEPARARYLALFAFLLARVANVDQDVSEAETAAMEELVRSHGHLPPAQATLVVQIAKAQHRLFGETWNHLATRELRDICAEDEKRELLQCLFAVAAADDVITVQEEEAVRQVANGLVITHADYVAIRSMYRDKRSVFKT